MCVKTEGYSHKCGYSYKYGHSENLRKKGYCRIFPRILVPVCAVIMILGGCGRYTEDYSFGKSDLEEFLAEEAEEDSARADVYGSGDTTGGDGQEAAISDHSEPDASADGENGSAWAENPDMNSGSDQESEDIYIGGLTRSEYDALPLEEQDKLRDAERKKVTPPYESAILPDYRELYDYNNAVIGYIYIDGTTIDGPVLQTLADYEYYLHRDIDGVESEPGCIILDADSEIGIGTREDGYLEGYEPSTIQLVHGHNMRNGTMFGSLLKYADESYADRHELIRYDSIYEHRTYEVICAFYSRIYPEESDEFKYYTYNQLDSESDYRQWWSGISDMALYQRDVEHGFPDEYIVLSTCAYQVEDGRFAVVGVRIDPDEIP